MAWTSKHVYHSQRTAVAAGAELDVDYSCVLVVPGHIPPVPPYRSSRQVQRDWARWAARVGMYQSSGAESVDCSRQCCVDCTSSITVLLAYDHSNAPQLRVWHGDRVTYLIRLASDWLARVRYYLPCLLMVSPYVRASFGLKAPIES